ncbi:MAG: hypothetical protein R3C49_14850 [Planctomycetaceae bacterium]
MRSRRNSAILTILLFAAWTIRPVLVQMNHSLPVRSEIITTVPLFNAWTIWWNGQSAINGFADYWDAPIFFPTRRSFAFSEPQPATLLVAPVIWLNGSPALAYNLYLLGSLMLNGLMTCRLLRLRHCGWVPAVGGALMMIWLPISLRQLEVLQLIPVWPILWVWSSLERHGRQPTRGSAIEIAAAVTAAFFTSIHHTLLMCVTLLPTAWLLLIAFRKRQFWIWSILAVILAAVPAGLLVVPMKRALSEHQFQRDEALVSQLSARPQNLWQPPHDAKIGIRARDSNGMSPGWIKVFLATAGIGYGLRRKRHRHLTAFLLLTIVVSGLLALGPNLQIGSARPWWNLTEFLPGLSQVRNVFRFMYLAQMAIILLMVTALNEVRLRMDSHRMPGWLTSSLVTGCVIMALVELPCPQIVLAGAPDLNRHLQWTEYVREHLPAGTGIACIPFSPGVSAHDFDVTARWMYIGSLHARPMVNGYSGFFPKNYLELRARISSEGLSQPVLVTLAEMQTYFVVVQPGTNVRPEALNADVGRYYLRLESGRQDDYRIFRLLDSSVPESAAAK